MKCNNCDTIAPIEELRIPIQTIRGDMRLHYPNRGLEPMIYMEMLLCDPCKKLFRMWSQRWLSWVSRTRL